MSTITYRAGDSMSCGICDSSLTAHEAHAPCLHGYMTGCDDCGDMARGGYSIAAYPDSAPPCQLLITEMETAIRACSTVYTEEYEACRARWSGIRTFTSPA